MQGSVGFDNEQIFPEYNSGHSMEQRINNFEKKADKQLQIQV